MGMGFQTCGWGSRQGQTFTSHQRGILYSLIFSFFSTISVCYIRLIEEKGELFYCFISDKKVEICAVDPNRPRFSFVVIILSA